MDITRTTCQYVSGCSLSRTPAFDPTLRVLRGLWSWDPRPHKVLFLHRDAEVASAGILVLVYNKVMSNWQFT